MTRSENLESILVVDDAEATVEVIERNLKAKGYRVLTASSATEAVKILKTSPVDLVITDLKMPGPSGLELVKHIRQTHSDTEVMMITGYATVEGAVEAVKSGAEEYLAKPFTDEELFLAVELSLEKLRARRASRRPGNESSKTPQVIVGESASMKEIREISSRAARSAATVLISGESGSGKELVAREIHYSGQRAAAPFVTVNCGSIKASLLESELFGHVKGAFKGAVDTRNGAFQMADKGTIFLDDIDELSLPIQVKLLKAIEDKEVFMLGSSDPQRVDVRVLAAADSDIAEMVAKESFSEDLYLRLGEIRIDIPPLREREDDISLLVRHFSVKLAKRWNRSLPRFTDEALSALCAYRWPGNVRELMDVVSHLIATVKSDIIDVLDLSELMQVGMLPGSGLNRALADVEATHIRQVLKNMNGNKTRAAEILGIDRKTLREKLKRYGT